jgi:AcrR family transcriptional regulator
VSRSRTNTKARSTTLRLDPEVRRAQLLATATTLFDDAEPAAVTLDAIAVAAGVSRSLVYAYFGDRGGVLAAVYLRAIEGLDAELGRAIGTAAPDERLLRTVVRHYLQFARDHEGAWQVIAAAGALDHPAVRGARRDRIDRIAGVWGKAPEARLVATGIVALLEAGVGHWHDERDLGIERTAALLTDVIWSGLHRMRD